MALDPSLLLPSAAVLQSIANPAPIASPLELQQKQLALQNARLQSQVNQQALQTGALGLQEKQRELAAQQAMDQAMQGAFKTNDDGTIEFDTQKIAQGLSSRGYGHVVPDMLENLTKANKATADLSKARADALEAQNDVKGFIANGVKQHFTPDSLITGITALSAQNVMHPADATQAVQDIQAHANDLAYLHQKYDPLLDQAIGSSKGVQTVQGTLLRGQAAAGELDLKQRAQALNALSTAASDGEYQQKLADLKAGGIPDRVLNEFAGKTWTPDLAKQLQAQALSPEQRTTVAKTAAETEALQVRNASLPLAQAASRSPAEYQQLLSTQPEAVQKRFAPLGPNPKFNDVLQTGLTGPEAVTAAHQAVAEQQRQTELGIQRGQLGVAQQRLALEQQFAPQTPGAQALTGEDFLKTLPVGAQTMVRGIANGDIAPPSAGSRSPAAQSLLKAVGQYDPTFNSNRFAAMKEFAQGGKSKQVNAINTAIGHLDLLDQAGQALKNGTFVPGNAIYNRFATTFGAPEQINANSIIQRVSGELNKATGSIGEGEQEAIKKNLSGNFAPAQIHGAVQTNIGLLGEAMDSLKQDYMRGTGFTVDQPKVKALLTPRAQQALSNMGFDPSTMKPVSAGVPPAGLPANAIVQRNKATHTYRYSTDGGKTWQTPQ